MSSSRIAAGRNRVAGQGVAGAVDDFPGTLCERVDPDLNPASAGFFLPVAMQDLARRSRVHQFVKRLPATSPLRTP